ncbi:hypothetical protein NEMBOFW57_005350 [Staphylotrichum longicolle]|uniref:Ribosome biogenesis protein Alb1 n=1 Tax=Staphylotrichum longicolle TaxID=669026 RepID=A0AAD4I063_9PEZI|nr:hypothetical protein NEMBOFW57_005350 [Staphylotrichum longicolle]
MAKPTIAKGKKGASKHSRAARRATSPSIDTDKSLKEVRVPQESVDRRPAVLAAHHAGGVTKKAKSGRKAVLSTKARRRQEKSADRAEAIMDRTSVKVQKSKGHARVIDSRKKTWDQINKEAFDREEPPKLSKKAKAKLTQTTRRPRAGAAKGRGLRGGKHKTLAKKRRFCRAGRQLMVFIYAR